MIQCIFRKSYGIVMEMIDDVKENDDDEEFFRKKSFSLIFKGNLF